MTMLGRRPITEQSMASGAVDVTADEIAARVNAGYVIQSTGGTFTATGAEQTLVMVAEPLGVWCPSLLILDLDNMAGGDTIVVKIYHRMYDGGALQLFKYHTWTGADGGLTNGEKLAQIELYPNRHGYQITLQQTAGVNRAYGWEFYAGV